MIELNTNNGTIINSYSFTTNLINADKIKSLTFLADTHEICGLIKDYSNPQSFIVLKYNIINNNESNFIIPGQNSIDFGEIISTITEQNLSTNNFNINQDNKIVKAFNILGQEIPIETYNQIIIVKYENGVTTKIYNQK